MSVTTRKIVAGLFVSLDGVADAPEISPHEWTNDEMMGRIAAGVAQADAVLLGSRTYSLLELTLHICPVVVGSGLRLFDEIADPVRLKLVDSVVYGNGVIGVTYSVS